MGDVLHREFVKASAYEGVIAKYDKLLADNSH